MPHEAKQSASATGMIQSRVDFVSIVHKDCLLRKQALANDRVNSLISQNKQSSFELFMKSLRSVKILFQKGYKGVLTEGSEIQDALA